MSQNALRNRWTYIESERRAGMSLGSFQHVRRLRGCGMSRRRGCTYPYVSRINVNTTNPERESTGRTLDPSMSTRYQFFFCAGPARVKFSSSTRVPGISANNGTTIYVMQWSRFIRENIFLSMRYELLGWDIRICNIFYHLLEANPRVIRADLALVESPNG